MPASSLLASRTPSLSAEFTAVGRNYPPTAASLGVYLLPHVAALSTRNWGWLAAERGTSGSLWCGWHQQRCWRDRRQARLLAARSRAAVGARAALHSASSAPFNPAVAAGRSTVAAGAAATAAPPSPSSVALPAALTPAISPRGIELGKAAVESAGDAWTGGNDGWPNGALLPSVTEVRTEVATGAGRTAAAETAATVAVAATTRKSRTSGPVILHAAEVQRDGSVVLRFAPLDDRLAPSAPFPRSPTASALATGSVSSVADAEGSARRGGARGAVGMATGGAGELGAEATGLVEGGRAVRADAGVVAFLTACTSDYSREVPDAVIEEIVGLPLQLTPVDHVAQWVAGTAQHVMAAVTAFSDAIRQPASSLRLHQPSLPALPHVLGLGKPLRSSTPPHMPHLSWVGENTSQAVAIAHESEAAGSGKKLSGRASDFHLPTSSPPAASQQQTGAHVVPSLSHLTPSPVSVPASAAAAAAAAQQHPSPTASLAVTAVTSVVLAGLVQFLASLTGLVGRVPGGSGGVGQSRLVWNLPAATVLLLVAVVKVWAARRSHNHMQQAARS